MKIQAKLRLRAAALDDWKDTITSTYGRNVQFKQAGDTYRAFVGTDMVGEYNGGDAKVVDTAGDMLTANDPGVPPTNDELLTDGTAFDTIVDGDPSTSTPLVQQVTLDDGGVTPPDEKELLMDDIVPPKAR